MLTQVPNLNVNEDLKNTTQPIYSLGIDFFE